MFSDFGEFSRARPFCSYPKHNEIVFDLLSIPADTQAAIRDVCNDFDLISSAANQHNTIKSPANVSTTFKSQNIVEEEEEAETETSGACNMVNTNEYQSRGEFTILPDTPPKSNDSSFAQIQESKSNVTDDQQVQREEVPSQQPNTTNAVAPPPSPPQPMEVEIVGGTAETNREPFDDDAVILVATTTRASTSANIDLTLQNALDDSNDADKSVEWKTVDFSKVSYCLEDAESLRPRHHLNDNVINAYLAIILDRLQRKHANLPRILLQDNFFLNTLSRDIDMNQSLAIAVNEYGFNRELCNEMIRKKARLIKRTKVFDADYLVIPLCHNEHWSLIVFCRAATRILLLDSIDFGDSHYAEHLNTLVHFLVSSFIVHKQGSDDEVEKLASTLLRNTDVPVVPRQTNTSDCGVYLLEYFEKFFENPTLDRDWSELVNRRKMKGKRKQIKNELTVLLK